ncbi:MAG: bifunctional diguanylate cyclase/phosphodiesterase [Janthinobacterium lividum]
MGQRNLQLEALRTASSIAGAAEQGMSRTIEAMDQRLRFARKLYERDPEGFSLRFIAEGSGFTDSVMMQLAFIDAKGMLRQTNLGPTLGVVNLSDRQHFRVQADRADDFLFISTPVIGRVSQRWSVQLTRKVSNPDGSMAGVLVGSLDPYWLTQFQDMLDVSGGLLLVGDDGVIRAAAPDQDLIGAHIEGMLLTRAVNGSEHGSFILSKLNGGSLQTAAKGDIIGFRRLRNYALTIIVRLDPGPIFEPFQNTRKAVMAAGAVLTLLILATGGLLARNRLRVITSQTSLRNAIENVDQGIVMLDADGRFSICNRRFTDLLMLPNPDTMPSADLWDRLWGKYPVQPGVHEEVAAAGGLLEVRTHLVKSGGFVRTYTDITDRRQAETRIMQLAQYDALTGLANRRTIETTVLEELEQARQHGTAMAVLCMDLDRFKLVNDTLGHAAGDELLRQTGHRLAHALGNHGVVGRMGGDEFVAVQTKLSETLEAEEVAKRIASAFDTPFLLDGRETIVGVSIGIAVFSGGVQSAADLLRNADIALYSAKKLGRGGFQLFEASMEAAMRARSELEQDLAQAVVAERLTLYYQPIYNQDATAITSYEALLRWHHPKHGWIPPSIFIPIAEESRVILPLGRWALTNACKAAALWDRPHGIAVNLSPVQVLDGSLFGLVAEALSEAGLDPGRLTLEVTEGVLMRDVTAARSALENLKAQGVRLALDDFGTGYSSLSYLSQFPFDTLKIDRSFTQNLDVDPGAKPIVQAIVAMGHSLDLSITAEGVETASQLNLLRKMGCNNFQGFLFGQPSLLPTEAVL